MRFRALMVAAGIAMGAVPALASPAATAPAEGAAVSDATINKAGAALRDVMKVQEAYQGRIQSAPSEAQKNGLSTQANAEALQAINSKGLSVEEYTRIVRLARTDPEVKQKLLNAAQ